MLCYVMLCHVMSCYVMLCHVMSCHVMLCHVILTRCPRRTLRSWQRPESPCISSCNCYTASVSPVCGANGVTYLSACFAGCTKAVSGNVGAGHQRAPNKDTFFVCAKQTHLFCLRRTNTPFLSAQNLTGCACVSATGDEAVALPGKCPSPGCQQAFLTFLCVICLCSMIGAMAQTPSVIILIRSDACSSHNRR
ncbi:solute carrier organic anion transporter family member 3A1-like [Entelurus aequoreus]|uniref:solute carrier organic anion transporter family member 3A1-like n=1 Tax=Entelurus aequoreus TaxID=161455 RepID=UPI002B1CFC5E|nr:solute carrier organic anion transporter family member 3A1-like [Entelurus aequoreus]